MKYEPFSILIHGNGKKRKWLFYSFLVVSLSSYCVMATFAFIADCILKASKEALHHLNSHSFHH
jgi:hypothetical protein